MHVDDETETEGLGVDEVFEVTYFPFSWLGREERAIKVGFFFRA